MEEKKCSKCKKTKNITEFHRCRDKYQSACKICRNKANRVYAKKNKQKITSYYKSRCASGKQKVCEKLCSDCKSIKSSGNFDKHPSNKDGLHTKCKDCRAKYRQKKKKEIAKYNDIYYQKNREIIIEKAVKRNLERLKTDLQFRLANRLRGRLNKALKNNYKSGSAVGDLGCSVKDLKNHLESKFQPGMKWENYGKWHIDHIIPLSSFNLEDREQLLKACHYTNLQPLWAKDNLEKGAKIIDNV
jgi:hypothetical protein